MKITTWTILYMMFFLSCKAQINNIKASKESNYVGIGLLKIDIKEPLKIYLNEINDSIDVLSFDKINVGDRKGSYDLKTDLKERLNPYRLFKGTSYEEAKQKGSYIEPQLIFRVISKTPSSFVVILNEISKETAIIKFEQNQTNNSSNYDQRTLSQKNEPYLFETWDTYLKRVQFILTDNSLYYRPNGKIKSKSNLKCAFTVLSVENEWAKVEPKLGIVGNDKYKNQKGWIKWRTNEVIQIQIIEYTIE